MHLKGLLKCNLNRLSGTAVLMFIFIRQGLMLGIHLSDGASEGPQQGKIWVMWLLASVQGEEEVVEEKKREDGTLLMPYRQMSKKYMMLFHEYEKVVRMGKHKNQQQ